MFRLATNQDLPAIEAALADLLAKSPAPQMVHADLMEAILSVRHAIHESRAVIVGDFLFMFQVGQIWYSRRQFLIEDIVLRLSRAEGTTIPEVIGVIEELGRKLGAIPIVGDAQIGRMQRYYEEAGYVPVGVQLMKG